MFDPESFDLKNGVMRQAAAIHGALRPGHRLVIGGRVYAINDDGLAAFAAEPLPHGQACAAPGVKAMNQMWTLQIRQELFDASRKPWRVGHHRVWIDNEGRQPLFEEAFGPSAWKRFHDYAG